MDEVNTPKLAIKTISANWKLDSYGKQQSLSTETSIERPVLH